MSTKQQIIKKRKFGYGNIPQNVNKKLKTLSMWNTVTNTKYICSFLWIVEKTTYVTKVIRVWSIDQTVI